MKGETLIFVVALVIIGLIFVKNLAPKLEEYGGSYISIENKTNSKNMIDDSLENNNTVNEAIPYIKNTVDVSSIQELRDKEN